jgi:class 3 adenylate cyclase
MYVFFRNQGITEDILLVDQNIRCCIGFIDMMNSTKVASRLSESQISKYYSVFLNSMSTIIKNFGGKIVKNAGDDLIFYFPPKPGSESLAFKHNARNALDCGSMMIDAHRAINSRLHEDKLHPINYRISLDYGPVQVANSKSSKSQDLFGSTMNICAKINSKANSNNMVIGEGLYNHLNKGIDRHFIIKEAGEIDLGLAYKDKYAIYHVESKRKNITNPFKHKITNKEMIGEG